MSTTALFIGWGGTHPGRERVAQEHYREWTSALEHMKAEGRIRDYETVLLMPHGGDLDGFTLVHGTPEALTALLAREDMTRLRAASMHDHARLMVVLATVGEGVDRQFALANETLADYDREPALI